MALMDGTLMICAITKKSMVGASRDRDVETETRSLPASD